MKNKGIEGKSRCPDCMANKTFFDKIKNKSEQYIFVFQFLMN